MTMIFDLPRDLIEEIIYRVPFNTMRAVRLTCKKWENLSKSRSFSKKHIDKALATAKEGESQIIMLMDYSLHLMNVTVNKNPTTKPLGQLTCLNEQVKICHVIHCEGLLLCFLKDDARLVVWNPYYGQTRWIKLRYSHCSDDADAKVRNPDTGMDHCWYALGYANKKNKSCRSHKILRFLDGRDYEIYDLNTDSWRILDVTPTPNWHISRYQTFGLSLKGNTYWCATKSNSNDERDDHIICFNFTKERFGLRLPFNAGHHDLVTLSCVREEKLAVLLAHNESNPYEMDIWITTKIDAKKLLWSKFLTLNTEAPNNYPFISTSFFIDEEKKIAMGFDEEDIDERHVLTFLGKDGYFKQLVLKEERDDKSSKVCSYVPSLVQIKQPKGGKRKRNSLEKPVNKEQYGLRKRKKKIQRDD